MPDQDRHEVLARFTALHGAPPLAGGLDAAAAALRALEVARGRLVRGTVGAEATIRRVARRLQELGKHPSLPGFEAWGIQLETAPPGALARQTLEALTGLRRVLASPVTQWMPTPPRVVFLGPSAPEGDDLEAALALPHRRVIRAATAEDARIVCRTRGVDVALLNLTVDPEGVRTLVSELRERPESSSCILLLDGADPALQAECYALGADLCLPSPHDPPLVAAVVAGQLDRLSRAREASVRDHLTGLVNRTGFREAHRRVRAEAERNGEPLSLAIVDLDRFKDVNDRFGHAAGDRVLLGVATVLESRLRDGDLVARWGGEEFAVLLPRTDPDGAMEALSSVLHQVTGRTFRTSEGRDLPPVTFSAGVADGRARLDKAMSDADRRLYRAKDGGRCRIEGPATDPRPEALPRTVPDD